MQSPRRKCHYYGYDAALLKTVLCAVKDQPLSVRQVLRRQIEDHALRLTFKGSSAEADELFELAGTLVTDDFGETLA